MNRGPSINTRLLNSMKLFPFFINPVIAVVWGLFFCFVYIIISSVSSQYGVFFSDECCSIGIRCQDVQKFLRNNDLVVVLYSTFIYLWWFSYIATVHLYQGVQNFVSQYPHMRIQVNQHFHPLTHSRKRYISYIAITANPSQRWGCCLLCSIASGHWSPYINPLRKMARNVRIQPHLKENRKFWHDKRNSHTTLFLHSWNAAKPRISSAVGLVELAIDTCISCGGIDADALLVGSEPELASTGLTADKIIAGFGDGLGLGLGLGDCGGIDSRNHEEEDGQELHFGLGFGLGTGKNVFLWRKETSALSKIKLAFWCVDGLIWWIAVDCCAGWEMEDEGKGFFTCVFPIWDLHRIYCCCSFFQLKHSSVDRDDLIADDHRQSEASRVIMLETLAPESST